MKNLYLSLLMVFLTSVSIAQIGVIENFDNSNSTIPFGWTASGFSGLQPRSCAEISEADAMSDSQADAGNLTTPYFTAASNATDLNISFDYKVTNFSFFGGEANAPTNWGSLTLEYTTNGTTWNNIVTLDEANYDAGTSCTTKTYLIPAASLPTGTDFQARFVSAHGTGSFQIYIDNVSFAQTPTQAPSCDAVITTPANGATGVLLDTELIWSNANGLPTGYKISVGTTVGGSELVNAEDVGNVNNYDITAALAYSTTYYVTILPYNSFGDATATCTQNSFTTRDAPIVGSSCSNPIVLDPATVDFTVQDSTNLYENFHSTTPCGGSYLMSGNEVVYSYTPTEETSLNLSVTNIENQRTALHVLDSCPGDTPNCIAFGESGNALDDIVLNNVILEAGTTYTFYISATSSNNNSNWDFAVHKNSCVIPSFELSAIGDCANAQFSVDVDITSLGSATSVTIGDDQGSADLSVSDLGVNSFGPYTENGYVHFTLTNDQDETCQITDSVVFYCPPANDDCANAEEVTVNAEYNCDNLTSGTTTAATPSVDDPSTCSSNINDIWYTFIATGSSQVIQLLNQQIVEGSNASMRVEVLSGVCGSLTSIICSNNNSGYETVSGLTMGDTYYLRIYSVNAANSQTFDLCISTPPAAPANDDCAAAEVLTESVDNTCNNSLTGTTVSATLSAENSCSGAYKDVWYSFTPTQTGDYVVRTSTESATSVYFRVYSGTCGDFTAVSSSCSSTMATIALTGDETYHIMVRTNSNTLGVDFNLCAYLFVAVENSSCSGALELLESDDASGNNTISGSTEAALYSPEGCSGSSNESVWYTFSPQYDGLYHMSLTTTSESGSAYFQMYTGNCTDGLTALEELTSCYNNGIEDVMLNSDSTYYIDVHSSSPADFDLFGYPDATIIPIPVPDNDSCAVALPILLSTTADCENMVTGTTLGSSASANNSCIGTRDVWYTFTPDADGYYEVTLSENDTTTTNVAVYSGNCGDLTALSENCSSHDLVMNLAGGTTYYVMVGSETALVGVAFDLCVTNFATAENNDCTDAIMLDESPTGAGENIVSGSTELSFYSPEGCASELFTSVWYTFIPTVSGLYHANLANVDGNSSFQVYSGDCEAGLTPLTELTDCNNSGDITITVEAGTTYYLDVHSLNPSTFDLFVYPHPTGIEEAEALNISYYPNPVNGKLTVNAPQAVRSITVYNVLGSEVLTATPNTSNFELNMDKLKAGVYMLKAEIGDKTGSFRIVKQ